MWSLRVVVVLLCSSLNDDLCRLNLVLNSFSVSPMYVSCFFVSVSVTVALYTTHLVRHFPSSGQLFFCRQLHNLSFWGDHFGVIPSFCVFAVGGNIYIYIKKKLYLFPPPSPFISFLLCLLLSLALVFSL